MLLDLLVFENYKYLLEYYKQLPCLPLYFCRVNF